MSAVPGCGGLLVEISGGGDSKTAAAYQSNPTLPALGRGELMTADAADSALVSVADGGREGIGGDSRHQLGEQATIGAPWALVATQSGIVTGQLLDDHPSRPGPCRGAIETEEGHPSPEVLVDDGINKRLTSASREGQAAIANTKREGLRDVPRVGGYAGGESSGPGAGRRGQEAQPLQQFRR